MSLRVLHAPYLVGGNPSNLARAERSLGASSWCVSLGPNPFGYACDEVAWRQRETWLTREWRRWALFRRALRDFDVLHFNSGQSILSWGGLFGGRERLTLLERAALALSPHLELLDLAAYKRAGRVIAVTYQGDEARQGDYSRAHFSDSIAHHVTGGYYSVWSDARKRQRIAKFARYADLIYALNPDLLHVLPSRARFLPYANVDLRDWRYIPPKADRGRVPLVLHAPSHRGVKGTEQLLAAVEQLKREGLEFEFRLVEGMPRDRARKLYEDADIFVDQLLAGWYGGVAVEAMALGKPVIAYIREADLDFVPVEMRRELPVIGADVRTIGGVLGRLIAAGPRERSELGRRGRAYVERWHDPLKIAAGLIRDYESAIESSRELECAGSRRFSRRRRPG
jgi:glycosyltransferase involved in cell wall biosynthesis